MGYKLIKVILPVLFALAPVTGCGQGSPTSPRITPTLSGDEFVLTGLISDGSGDDGTPLAGVELVLSPVDQVAAAAPAQDMGPQSFSVMTDEDGRFTVSVARGSWNIALSKPGYADRTIALAVNGDMTANFSMVKLDAYSARRR